MNKYYIISFIIGIFVFSNGIITKSNMLIILGLVNMFFALFFSSLEWYLDYTRLYKNNITFVKVGDEFPSYELRRGYDGKKEIGKE